MEEIARIFDGDNAEVGDAMVKEVPGLSNDRYDFKEHEDPEKAEGVVHVSDVKT